MLFDRRTFLAAPLAMAAATPPPPASGAPSTRYGQIGKLKARPGQRDAVVAMILRGVTAMPGCLSYVVALDAGDADTIWISEAWDGKASHDASLAIPAVRAAITAAMPLIAGVEPGAETVPIGGYNLGPAAR